MTDPARAVTDPARAATGSAHEATGSARPETARVRPDTAPVARGVADPAPTLIDAARRDAYLHRIGARRPASPDAAALRGLHLRHLLAVPFENLSIHLGEDIVLEEKALVDKVVRDRRGGFCYELNGAFAALLRAFGYEVELLSARGVGPKGLGVPFDHLALRVHTPDGPLLADVGFGDHSHHPLRLDTRADQRDPAGVFRVEETIQGDLDVLKDGAPRYRLEQRPRSLAEFEVGSWWHRTSPGSPFTRSLICSRLTGSGGRITLKGRTLVETDSEGRREERELAKSEVLSAYLTYFGLALTRIPEPAPRPPATPTAS